MTMAASLLTHRQKVITLSAINEIIASFIPTRCPVHSVLPVAVARVAPIRSPSQLGIHDWPFLQAGLSRPSARFEPGIIWLRFCDGRMPS